MFANAEAVRYLRVPQAYSRAELQRLEEFAKEWGAKGLAYLVTDEEGEVRSPIAKFLSAAELAALRPDPGTTLLFAADTWPMTSRVLGALRTRLGQELGLVDESAWRFLWVTDFPMFEWDEEAGRWSAVHHPFTRPARDWESGSERPGACARPRIRPDLQRQRAGRRLVPDPRARRSRRRSSTCSALGPDEQRAKFGFLLDALAMGAPPHGGIALGIDRMTMVLAGEENLRDVIAFPKNQAGVDPMSGAPSEVSAAQLDELGLTIVVQEADS